MSALFQSLSEVLEKVETTKKRLQIIDHTAAYLKTLGSKEIKAAVDMMVGRAFPKYSQKILDVSWSTLSAIFERVSVFEWDLFRQAMAKTGDIGSAAKTVLENSKATKQTQLTQRSLTITDVCQAFDAIAQAQGAGSRIKKERLITALLNQATPTEAKYLIKIFTGEMRIGLSEGLMEQAIAFAFDISLSKVQYAAMVLGDIGEVAETLKEQGADGLERVGFRVFRPVQLMLAQTAQNIQEALDMQGGETAFEYKYDGARVQVHKQGDQVQIFSRRLTDVTASMPEIVGTVKANVKTESAIFEGEVVSLDSAGYPIAFQHLMRRFKRTRDIGGMAEKIPLTLFVFDILYLNGKSLINKPYTQRRQILTQTANKISLTEQLVTDQPQAAQAFLKAALVAGHEGLMAKKLDGPYTPGRRGKRWLKIKPILEPLDLVITAAEYGYGRRKGWLSDYYLGALDPQTGSFRNIGKTFKGLTDNEIIQLTRQLKKSAVNQQGHRIVVVPQIVVEVAYNEIQQSPKYKSGMALRFARITKIRDDKNPADASTIGQVREIYERQFHNKGKYSMN